MKRNLTPNLLARAEKETSPPDPLSMAATGKRFEQSGEGEKGVAGL
jgi:hypothetical protein